jgi:hypothetical protein
VNRSGTCNATITNSEKREFRCDVAGPHTAQCPCQGGSPLHHIALYSTLGLCSTTVDMIVINETVKPKANNGYPSPALVGLIILLHGR